MTSTDGDAMASPATLAATLRYLRRQRGLTQRHLLRPLHLASHTAIVDFEAGRRIPSPEIIDAYERVLGCRPGLLRQLRDRELARQVEPGRAGEPGPPAGVPVQLPAMPSHFTGRRVELAALDTLCDVRAAERSGIRVGLISGGVGVGKSGLAVAWGHSVSARFPDGQLFADLRAKTGAPTPTGQVLAGFLRALGVAEDRIPTDVDQAAALFRSLLAGRRALIVLDDAESSRQVRPLLPGRGACVTLVTGRDRLPGLAVASGVRPIRLDAMPPDEATGLLARLLGPAEPAQLGRLAELCDHLPLALRLAAGRLADRPAEEVDGLVEALERVGPLRLLTCDDEDFDLYAGVDRAYRRLGAAAQQTLRLVALAPGPDLSRAALAALGPTSPRAPELVSELVAADLVRLGPGDRLRLPRLARGYADEHARDDPPKGRRQARVRLMRFYLGHTDAAARLLYPQMARLPSATAGRACRGAGPADAAQAVDWLDAERACLVAAVRDAAAHGPAPFAWQLADALRGYVWLRPRHADWVDVAQRVLVCARRSAEPAARAVAELFEADAWHVAGRPGEAVVAYRRAAETATRAGWPEGVAAAYANSAGAHRTLGDPRTARDALEQALRINRQVANLGGQAAALDSLGAVHADLDDRRAAAAYHARALALYRLIGSPTGIETAAGNLGLLLPDADRSTPRPQPRGLDVCAAAQPDRARRADHQIGPVGGAVGERP